MLTNLHIRHFAIIDSSELEFSWGMTALTGETGAGKSILLDALGLVLGSRASTDSIQQGASRADITATFSLDALPHVLAWLLEHELTDEVDNTAGVPAECLVRRTVSANGKSRATVNDVPVSVQTLKTLGEKLVSIHGQHAYQTLGKAIEQRALLDKYAGTAQLVKVGKAHAAWDKTHHALLDFTKNSRDREQRIDLLRFQLQEFDDLDIGGESVDNIESEHRWLANSERILALSQETLGAIDDTASPALNRSIPALTELVGIDERLREALDLVESASIQIAEASQLIRSTSGNMEHDGSRLAWLDQKLAALHRLARKHQCAMNELADVENTLRDELDTMSSPDQAIDQLQAEVEALRALYDTESAKLTRHRRKHAKALGKIVTDAMQSLNMTGGEFQITVSNDVSEPHPLGMNSVAFLVSPNPGVAPAALSKIASGGELSRISLCLQLATIDTQPVPTLIFDEVDAGVGGAVAETVGQLLRRVGNRAQVICVTHLPQVAAQAHNHLLIAKQVSAGKTSTSVQPLNKKATKDEIARMLGGAKITAKTRQHAQEMLNAAAETE